GDRITDLLIGDPGVSSASIFYGRAKADWGTAPLLNASFTGTPAPPETTPFKIDGFQVENVISPAPDGQVPVPGLWHVTSQRATDPGHSGPTSLYFGQDTLGNYNVGRTAGRLTSLPDIDLTGL